MSETSEYRRPKRIVASSSAPVEQSERTVSASPQVPENQPKRKEPSIREDIPVYLTLIRYITTYLIEHEGIISKEAIMIAVNPDITDVQLHVGMGATFLVYSIPIHPGVMLTRSWPSRLELRPFGASVAQDHTEAERIICKKPRIRTTGAGLVTDTINKDRLEAILLEVRALTHPPLFYHKNIVDFLGVAWDREVATYDPREWPSDDSDRPPTRIPIIILEHARHGSLADFIETETFSQFGFEARASICRDVAEGIAALHRCGIVHGDVKPDNILIFDSPDRDSDAPGMPFLHRAKIGDFGFSVAEHGSETTWTLKGRTWPWNDPEWNRPKTWNHLKKTDVFSYGLLSWVILTNKSLEELFDIDFAKVDTRENEVRDRVEAMKDWTLPLNAANYFKAGDAIQRLVTEYLFSASLDYRVEFRGDMLNILELWNTFFTGLGCQPYQATPPDKSIKYSTIRTLKDRAARYQFQTIARWSELLPLSIKQHLADIIDDHPTAEANWRGTVFRAFCYLTGLGVEMDLDYGKRLIDEATQITPLSAVFQTMFLPRPEPGDQPCEQTEYSKLVATFLRFAQIIGSHEATQKLKQYFPIAGGYSGLRSKAYRSLKYRISGDPQPTGGGERSNLMDQEADIRSNFSLRSHLLSNVRHTELHFAVAMGYTEAVGAMLASPTFDRSVLALPDYNGDTPFLLALRFGLFQIAGMLINSGSDVNVLNFHGENAFHFLVEFDDLKEKTELAGLLFALCDRSLATSPCRQSSFPKEQIWLLGEGSGTPLNRIVFRNDVSLAKIFMEHGISPLASGTEQGGVSALFQAGVCHSYDMLKIFYGAFPHVREWSEDDMLADACVCFRPQRMYLHGTKTYQNMVNALDFLMDKMPKSRLGQPFVRGVPILHWAISRAIDQEIMQHLITRSSRKAINTYTSAADLEVTTLHIAIQNGHSKIVASLLEKGADTQLPIRNASRGIVIPTLNACCMTFSSSNNILQQILKDYIARSQPLPEEALVSALLNNNFSAASVLVKAGADCNSTDSTGNTVLGRVIRRCTYDSLAQVRFLLEYPPSIGKPAANFVVKPQLGSTALHLLASMPAITPMYDRQALKSMADYLVHRFNSAAELNMQAGPSAMTALHIAAAGANAVVVWKLLEQQNIDVALTTLKGKSARQYCDDSMALEVPVIVKSCGESAIKRYKEDVIETRNLFAEKFGEKDNDWRSAVKLDQVALGGGKFLHFMLIERPAS